MKGANMGITICYTWYQFDQDVRKIADWLNNNKIRIETVYGIPKGGLPLATTLANVLNIPLSLSLSRAKSIVPPGTTLIVDDVSDTGKTLNNILDKDKYIIITLCIKPGTTYRPTYWCREVPDSEWIQFPWEVLSDD